MTGMAMMQILIRMSIQGSIIVGIVWILRMVFRGLRISYRYCVLLWGIVFFYLIFPWKIENEHGFWRAQPESMVVAVSADGPTVVTGLGTGIVLGQSAVPEQNVTPGQSTLPEQMNGTVSPAVGLQALKYLLCIVQHHGAGIQFQRAIWYDPRIMPALTGVVVHEEHMVRHHTAEPQFGLVLRLLLGSRCFCNLDFHRCRIPFCF